MSSDGQIIDLETPLYAAIEGGSTLTEVKGLLSSGSDVNADGPCKKTPLYTAIEKGSRLEIINALLAAGANVNTKVANEETALYCAVRRGRELEVIEALLLAGGDINYKVGQTTLLHKVCRVDVANELLSRGLKVNAANTIGQTPLHSVLFNPSIGNTFSLVRELLVHGANVNARDSCGFTPLHVIVMMHQEKPDLATVKELLKFGGNMNARDISGRTPLYHAMESCSKMHPTFINIELVRILILYGGDINAGCGCSTPLDVTLMSGNMVWVKILIKLALLRNYDDSYKTIIQLHSHNTFIHKELLTFFKNCKVEIHRMKHMILGNNLSLYDFLIKCHQRFWLCLNTEIIEEEILINCPVYCDIILPQVRLCVERVGLIEKLKHLQISVCKENRETVLVHDCLVKVVEYLSSSDLTNLITAGNMISG